MEFVYLKKPTSQLSTDFLHSKQPIQKLTLTDYITKLNSIQFNSGRCQTIPKYLELFYAQDFATYFFFFIIIIIWSCLVVISSCPPRCNFQTKSSKIPFWSLSFMMMILFGVAFHNKIRRKPNHQKFPSTFKYRITTCDLGNATVTVKIFNILP